MKMKDWTGNGNSVYKTLGASNHTNAEREAHDFYATDPVAARWLLKLETFYPDIWECACGQGHLSREIEKAGYNVRSTDIIDRGFGMGGVDFLGIDNTSWHGDIITNPPYKFAREFVEKALSIVPCGAKVAMFLKLQFLEGKARRALFEIFPPRTVYVSSSRLLCAKNGDFAGLEGKGSAQAYAWFVWEKGFKGVPQIKWFN